jgi:ribosomal protein S18 acetylase RimI-like enzyme
VLLIRPYSEDDLEVCRALWAELTQHHRDLYGDQSIGGTEPGLQFDAHRDRADLVGLWIAEEDGNPVGLTGLLLQGDEAQIEPVIVTAARRGNGIGDALLRHARAEAIARDARFLSVMPVARNTRAIKKFISAGFTTVGLIDLFEDLRPGERDWLPGFAPDPSLRY